MRAPTAELPTVEPSGGTSMARPVRINVDAEPSAFGAAPAQALQRLSGVVEQSSDQAARYGLMRQDLVNETAAVQELNVVETQHANYNHDPKTGFLTKRGQDAFTNYPQAVKDLNQMTADGRAALPNDAARRMYDQQAQRSTRYAIMQAGAHADQETKNWIQQSAQGRIETVINNGALNWNDPKQVDYTMGQLAVEVASKGQLEGIPAEAVQAETAKQQSRFLSSVVHQALAHDVHAGAALLDKYKGQMDARDMASLDQAVQIKSNTELARSIALEDRAQRRAEHDMHMSQGSNYAQFYSQAIAPNGAPPDAGTISEAVRLQKITPEQANHINNAVAGKTGVTDDNATLSYLLPMAHKGSDPEFYNTVADAGARHLLTPATVDGLLKTFSARSQHTEDQAETLARQSLHEALGVTPQTPFDFTKPGEAEKASLVSQADIEWDKRVIVNKEPWSQVYDDLHQRFAKFLPNANDIRALPNPKFGAVGSVNDVASVWQKTKDALSTGAITPDAYQREGELLQRYNAYYAEQDRVAQQKALAPAAKSGVKPKPGQ